MRKIQAKTLGRLLSAYLAGFPNQAAEDLREADPGEGAELLLLLPPGATWTVLREIGARPAREWLALCDDEMLRRLLREAPPGEPHSILVDAPEAFTLRILELSSS
ncbi:MAG: hypothetical protein R2729_29245 [Bryobacteraceae bacterium]